MTITAYVDRFDAALYLSGQADGQIVVRYDQGRVSVTDDGNPVFIVDNANDISVFVINGVDLAGTPVVTVLGGSGDDFPSLRGTRFNARGGDGNDVINGSDLADVLQGGLAPDTLDGRGGSDTADYSDKTTRVVATLTGATDATVSVGGVAEDTIRNVENLIGGTANDTFTGDGLANRLDGRNGIDLLKGEGGRDALISGRGADDLYAGADNVRDTFILAGKTDSGTTSTTRDQLFQFDRSLSATDTSSDKIDLRLLDADPAAGDQAFRFVTSFTRPTSTQSDGQVRVVDAGAHVNVQIDLNGDRAADMLLQVMNIDTLTGRDFLL